MHVSHVSRKTYFCMCVSMSIPSSSSVKRGEVRAGKITWINRSNRNSNSMREDSRQILAECVKRIKAYAASMLVYLPLFSVCVFVAVMWVCMKNKNLGGDKKEILLLMVELAALCFSIQFKSIGRWIRLMWCLNLLVSTMLRAVSPLYKSLSILLCIDFRGWCSEEAIPLFAYSYLLPQKPNSQVKHCKERCKVLYHTRTFWMQHSRRRQMTH